jgi:uncharacterized protein YjiS (DUF1127 family)
MSVVMFNTETRTGIAALFGRVMRAVVLARINLADWNDRRATRRALSGLTDRELSDIGLMRGDLDDMR